MKEAARTQQSIRHFPHAAIQRINRINILPCAVKSGKAARENDNERKVFMQSILEEFAYGNISPEAQFFTRDSEFGRAMNLVSRNEQKLLDRLGADDKDQFEKYVDAQGEVNRLTAMKNLLYGYKLGVVMTAEAFVTSGELIAGAEDC